METIERQISAACLGVKEAVEKIHIETGVKDKTVNFWMEQLLDKARKAHEDRLFNQEIRDPCLNDKKITGPAREKIKHEIKLDIQRELLDWVMRQPTERFAQSEQGSPEFRVQYLYSRCSKTHSFVANRHSLPPGDHYRALLKISGKLECDSVAKRFTDSHWRT